MMTEEQRLIEKLRRIEQLYSGTTSVGEREASAQALKRVRQRLEAIQQQDPPVEYRFTLADSWSRRLLLALLRRYGIRPYRYYRQRHTTVMVRVSQQFVDEILWPEFEALQDTLCTYLDQVTNRVIAAGVFADSADAEVVSDAAKGLPDPGDS